MKASQELDSIFIGNVTLQVTSELLREMEFVVVPLKLLDSYFRGFT